MKNIIKRFSLFLLCAICVTAFACCFLDGLASDSSQNSSVEINSEVSDSSKIEDSSNVQQESDSMVSSEDSSEAETPDSSVSSSAEEEDENELPRVPYKG